MTDDAFAVGAQKYQLFQAQIAFQNRRASSDFHN
jgi:hypothetical protein